MCERLTASDSGRSESKHSLEEKCFFITQTEAAFLFYVYKFSCMSPGLNRVFQPFFYVRIIVTKDDLDIRLGLT